MNEIENRAVDKIVDKFEERELLFADTKAYMSALYYLLEREVETLRLIFRGKTEIFCAKLEERLKSFYPEKDRDVEQGVVSVRSRKDGPIGAFTFEDLLAKLQKEIDSKEM